MLPRDNEVPTLGDMQRSMPWIWLSCDGLNCSHTRSIAVAPFVIRYGADTSSNVLRRRARCIACGHLGAMTMHPGVSGLLINPFPVNSRQLGDEL
jgi:hypothetical protein